MNIYIIIFWVSFIVIFYTYFGYGTLIYFINQLKRSNRKSTENNKEHTPDISFVIPAYNEEFVIQQKIENTLQLDYPKQKVKVLVVADGSTDNTKSIVAQNSTVELHYLPQRKGKVAAMNRVMQYIKTPIVIFSDANTLLKSDALKKLVEPYQNPEIGAVAGEKVVITENDQQATSNEGLYWKYESFLKRQDAEFYSVVGAAGELFSLRTNLYQAIEEDTILDDFMLSFKVNLQGYRVAYASEAKAHELPSASIEEEEKRKVRISAGGFQAMSRLTELWNIFKYPKLSFQYFSHRVFRWTVCPPALIFLWLSNGFLVIEHYLYVITFVLQSTFYMLAAFGWIFSQSNINFKVASIAYYFVFMNVSAIKGAIRFFRKSQSAVWEKAKRMENVRVETVNDVIL